MTVSYTGFTEPRATAGLPRTQFFGGSPRRDRD